MLADLCTISIDFCDEMEPWKNVNSYVVKVNIKILEVCETWNRKCVRVCVKAVQQLVVSKKFISTDNLNTMFNFMVHMDEDNIGNEGTSSCMEKELWNKQVAC